MPIDPKDFASLDRTDEGVKALKVILNNPDEIYAGQAMIMLIGIIVIYSNGRNGTLPGRPGRWIWGAALVRQVRVNTGKYG